MTEYITRNHHCEEFEVIIKTNSFEQYKAAEEFARRLIDHAKPMSNADRIRAMSDKELAWFMAERYAKESVLRLRDSGCEPTATQIKALTEQLYYTWVRWLLQPAEDE